MNAATTLTSLRLALNRSNTVVAQIAGDGMVTGPVREVADAIEHATGLSTDFVVYESVTALLAAEESDSWDAAFIAADPAHGARVQFTSPYISVPATLVVAHPSPFQSVADLDRPGIVIASVQGAAFDRRLRNHLEFASVEAFPSVAAAVARVAGSKASAAAGLRSMLDHAALADRSLRVLPDNFALLGQALAVPVASAQLVDILSRVIDARQELADRPID